MNFAKKPVVGNTEGSAAQRLANKMRPVVTHRDQLEITDWPYTPKKGSYKVLMKPGEMYFWCTCGLSVNQPFCDGSHVKQDNGYKPLAFTYDGPEKVRSVCACKMNKYSSGPFCDRSHRLVEFDDMDANHELGFNSKEWFEGPLPDLPKK
mmetsp:Transcript_1720/g.1161  ORF Transcript_1720/g.1161 Transcript_1720/m.1161 type:complete len:150 (-) Transcript_1720:115-564(-)|eukprot:CAMPEP_0116874232 /NCGR_PEP_ID=MMETSP0463-20121206/5670_1 /TAXON_ID=181622 /ORGANISM="Strombidinopsis sp, Strain SopsisLIS2011" /LENGTH=149 /DNA_ID=CAMNT_0004517623 /DNA_START=76 /DNA_END=525 /DNA_ORIENTATION=-